MEVEVFDVLSCDFVEVVDGKCEEGVVGGGSGSRLSESGCISCCD